MEIFRDWPDPEKMNPVHNYAGALLVAGLGAWNVVDPWLMPATLGAVCVVASAILTWGTWTRGSRSREFWRYFRAAVIVLLVLVFLVWSAMRGWQAADERHAEIEAASPSTRP